jgi:hypothetical protein
MTSEVKQSCEKLGYKSKKVKKLSDKNNNNRGSIEQIIQNQTPIVRLNRMTMFD